MWMRSCRLSEQNSSVHGVLLDSGLLDGTIRIEDEEYFVEPAKNYFSPLQHFHSVVYKLSDIRFPETNRTCMESVVRTNDCQHHSHTKRSVRSNSHREEELKVLKSHQRLVHKHSRQGNHRKTRLRKHFHSSKRHGSQPARHRDGRKHSRHHFKPDRNEGFEYLKDDGREFPKYSPKFSANNIKKIEQWLKDFEDTMRLDPDSDFSSANLESSSSSSLNANYFENQTLTEPFTLSSDQNDRTISNATDGTTPHGLTTVRIEPETSMEDKDDVPYWRELDALHYTEDGRTGSSEPYGVRSIQRTQWNDDRGQRGHVAVDRRKSTCLLYLQADHLFYQRMGSEEACIDAMTRHVQRVNSIYRTTGEYCFVSSFFSRGEELEIYLCIILK
ncbi:hypothetical protein AVEN_121036-1 [Araneus ventricosus]|uniref:Uncharacterized protein n=1 Tax=Araneus ventricosus TaxID=182803 RepID=A0A4Y2F621_ARAVE|nr:hypothetical protein AVEN_121036-1 [Araneus ventricosus]